MNCSWMLLGVYRGDEDDPGSLDWCIRELKKKRHASKHPDYHTLKATMTQILSGLILDDNDNLILLIFSALGYKIIQNLLNSTNFKGLHGIMVSLYPGDNSPRIGISHGYFICGKIIPRIAIEVQKLLLSLRISFSSRKKILRISFMFLEVSCWDLGPKSLWVRVLWACLHVI